MLGADELSWCQYPTTHEGAEGASDAHPEAGLLEALDDVDGRLGLLQLLIELLARA